MAITISGNGITSANIADSAITSAKINDGTITTDDINASDVTSLKSGRKNLIINGAMQVAQRGTSIGPFTSNQYTLDRWLGATSSESCTVSQQSFTAGQTDVPGFTKYIRNVITTTAAYAALTQRIEDVERLGGQTVTLSFWARGGQGGQGIPTTWRTYYLQDYGSGGSASTSNGFTSHTLTSSWQKFTTTVTLSSVAGKTIGAGSYTEFYFQQTGTEACDFDITGVQLELGDTATDFEHRSYGEELALCQRYFERWDITNSTENLVGIGYNHGTTQVLTHVWFKTEKRTAPSLSFSAVGGHQILTTSGWQACTGISAQANTKSTRIHLTGLSGLTSMGACEYRLDVGSSAYFDVDAEL